MKPGPGIPNPGFYATCQLSLTYGIVIVRAIDGHSVPILSPPVNTRQALHLSAYAD